MLGVCRMCHAPRAQFAKSNVSEGEEEEVLCENINLGTNNALGWRMFTKIVPKIILRKMSY